MHTHAQTRLYQNPRLAIIVYSTKTSKHRCINTRFADTLGKASIQIVRMP